MGNAVLADDVGRGMAVRRPQDVRHHDGHVDQLRQVRGPDVQAERGGQPEVGGFPVAQPQADVAGQDVQHVAVRRPGARVLERVLSESVGRVAALLRQLFRGRIGRRRLNGTASTRPVGTFGVHAGRVVRHCALLARYIIIQQTSALGTTIRILFLDSFMPDAFCYNYYYSFRPSDIIASLFSVAFSV